MLAPLLLAIFVITVGYGFLLPILPFTIERMAGTADPAALSRHTGLLTGTYTLALFLFAPLWGRFADRYGRRPMILLGLAGFGTCHLLFTLAGSLPLLYLSRFLAGLFASAVAPAAYALIADHAPSRERRAYRFALLNIAGALGFLAGPMLGAFTLFSVRSLFPNLSESFVLGSPFYVTSGLVFLAVLAVWAVEPTARRPRPPKEKPPDAVKRARATVLRLLAVSFVTAAAVGAFEVGLSLRATQILRLDAYQIGLMFTECSLVMLIVQAIVFSPLIKPVTTRWLLTPALIILATGLAAVPLASTTIAMGSAVALVAASAGVLSPIATYWTSLVADERQGAELGRETAAASLGQATGSAMGGMLFNITLLPNASFTLTAALVLSALAATIGLPRLLSRTGAQAVVESRLP